MLRIARSLVAIAGLSIAFLGIFIASSLLPWLLFSKKGWGNGLNQARWEYRPRESEVMEYMITIDLPRELRKTVYIEEEGNFVHLKSSAEDFHRSYTLPVGFEVDWQAKLAASDPHRVVVG